MRERRDPRTFGQGPYDGRRGRRRGPPAYPRDRAAPLAAAFHPWTTLSDLVALVDFAVIHDLAPNIELVHWTIRLLLPEGSLLLGHPDMAPHLGDYDVAALGYRWSAADPAVDALQVELAALVGAQDAAGAPPVETFAAVAATIRQAAGLTAEAPQVPWAA